MKIAFIVLTSIVLLTMFACQKAKNADVDAFISTHSTIVNDVVQIVTTDPSVQGVEKAQKYFDQRRADLRAKLAKMDSVQAADVNEDQMKKFQEQLWTDNDKLFGPVKALASNMTWDTAAVEKYNRLIADIRPQTPSEKQAK